MMASGFTTGQVKNARHGLALSFAARNCEQVMNVLSGTRSPATVNAPNSQGLGGTTPEATFPSNAGT